MFVPFDRAVRVNLGVVALGTPQRLIDCVEALVAHDSRHDFTIGCVVNDAGAAQGARPLPGGVLAERLRGNLGWAGGLHRARSLTDAELFVWVQEDMTPTAGWLDALVEAADAHPHVGAFGSVRVGSEGQVLLNNAGHARPAGDVARWNLADDTDARMPSDVTTYDWVTSKGLLTRSRVFDEVCGPDPRLFPVNHVDKDFCTHVRCHGWDVALVPGARLQHLGGQASPSAFRILVGEWRDQWFNERWAESVGRLAGSSSASIEHPCAEWRELRADPVEAAVGIEASRMVVPFARNSAAAYAALEAHAVAQTESAAAAHQHAHGSEQHFLKALEQARSLSAERRQLKRRVRRLRRERDEARAELAGPRSRSLGDRVRQLVRRPRGR